MRRARHTTSAWAAVATSVCAQLAVVVRRYNPTTVESKLVHTMRGMRFAPVAKFHGLF
jgi:hypothetical protein